MPDGDRLFRVGSVWKHNGTGLEFRIGLRLEDGTFKLRFAKEATLTARLALLEAWTAEDLLRDFTMVDHNVPQNRYELLMENASEDTDPV